MRRDIPRGAIMWWSGSIASIPLTWRLCDGTRFTPDLRNRFLVGAGDTYSVDDTGGQLIHAHDFTGDGHAHNISFGVQITPGADFLDGTSPVAITGTTENKSSLPNYHSLVYVMYDGRLR